MEWEVSKPGKICDVLYDPKMFYIPRTGVFPNDRFMSATEKRDGHWAKGDSKGEEEKSPVASLAMVEWKEPTI